jgi:hypothetical protein
MRRDPKQVALETAAALSKDTGTMSYVYKYGSSYEVLHSIIFDSTEQYSEQRHGGTCEFNYSVDQEPILVAVFDATGVQVM